MNQVNGQAQGNNAVKPNGQAPATGQAASAAPSETMEQLVARLTAENERLKAKAASQSTIALKVSEKGGLSMYGLGRFPVTLYASQWRRLIAEIKSGRVDDFLSVNAATLKEKE